MLAGAETINVGPRSLASYEGDFVGCETDRLAVLVMKLLDPGHQCPTAHVQGIIDASAAS